jgi:hypothetical protein
MRNSLSDLNDVVMKRISLILWTVLLLFFNVPIMQGQTNSKQNLQGIWQMCFYVSSSPDVPGELKPSNSFKMLTSEGKFANMTVVPNRGAIIIGSGTYHVVSDGKYIEHVEKSLDLPQLNGTDNVLYFTLREEDDVLVLKYYVKKDKDGNDIDTWVYETWKRVIMPATFPKDLVR